MRKVLFMMLLLPLFVFAQDDDGPATGEETYEAYGVAQPAQFKGGDKALAKFIQKNIQYPDSALKYETQGMVLVSFVVNKRGQVVQCKVLTPPRGNGLEEEAVRVIQLTSGLWKPALQRDQPVNMRFSMPINFQLY